MNRTEERHECHVYQDTGDGKHHAGFKFPVDEETSAIVHIYQWQNGAGMGATLQQVRDLHTFFAQLEEEMVRRMPEIIGKEIVGEI